MAEYEFWELRNVHFRTILEQLKTEKAIAKNINIIKSLSDNPFAIYTLKNFTSVANVFEITYNTTVQNTMYFMDTIYQGIYVSAMHLYYVKKKHLKVIYRIFTRYAWA